MPLYAYHGCECGPRDEFRPVADRDKPCSNCGGIVYRTLSNAAPIATRGLTMSGEEIRSRGMHEMMMMHKAHCEKPENARTIRENGIDLRGPKEYHPVIPKAVH